VTWSCIEFEKMSRSSYRESMKTIISEKGQVTIPKLLRDRLGLLPGQVLDFREEKGRLVATKAQTSDPAGALFGILRTKQRTAQTMTALRGKPDPR
jgi:AbrB family looped-hinge helix DNA binding protein